MTRSIVVLALVLGSSTLATGCGASAGGAFRSSHVRHVVERERSGIIELDGPIVPATADAHVVMTEHCQGRWRRVGAAEAMAMLHQDREAKTDAAAREESWTEDDDRVIAYECASAR